MGAPCDRLPHCHRPADSRRAAQTPPTSAPPWRPHRRTGRSRKRSERPPAKLRRRISRSSCSSSSSRTPPPHPGQGARWDEVRHEVKRSQSVRYDAGSEHLRIPWSSRMAKSEVNDERPTLECAPRVPQSLRTPNLTSSLPPCAARCLWLGLVFKEYTTGEGATRCGFRSWLWT